MVNINHYKYDEESRFANWADEVFVFPGALHAVAMKPAWAHITANLNMSTNKF